MMFKDKPIRVIMIGNAKESFIRLNEIVGQQTKLGKESTQDMQLIKSIKNKIELLKQNPFYGDNIKKELIPKSFNVPNLWRIELTNYWRMIYTIRGDELEIVCFVLEIIDHPEYDKFFGYRKK
jgi:Txe/YoeB family toxin of Txe-Axe toxin-antitoxin module